MFISSLLLSWAGLQGPSGPPDGAFPHALQVGRARGWAFSIFILTEEEPNPEHCPSELSLAQLNGERWVQRVWDERLALPPSACDSGNWEQTSSLRSRLPGSCGLKPASCFGFLEPPGWPPQVLLSLSPACGAGKGSGGICEFTHGRTALSRVPSWGAGLP